MQRKRVDLPEPDLPRRATISPSCNRRLTSSSTGSGWPAGVVKLLLTWFTSRITSPVGSGPKAVLGRWSVICPPRSGSKRVPGFRQAVERAPQQPVYYHYIEAHDDDSREDLGEVALRGGLRDVSAEAAGDQVMLSVGDDLGHDRGVPRSAGGGNAPGHVVREDSGQDQLPPSLLPGEAELVRHLPQLGGNGTGSRDDVEQDVPL